MIPYRLLFSGWRALLRWIDSIVEPPIMRRIVNRRSLEYFRTEDRFRDRSGLGDMAGDHADDYDHPHRLTGG